MATEDATPYTAAPATRPPDAAVRLALHRLIDRLDAEGARRLLRFVEVWVQPRPRREAPEPEEGC